MKQKKPLIETNPYLRDPKQRSKLIRRSVLTSSAVDGIYVDLPPDEEEIEQEDKQVGSS
jgi:hypothetical protein